MPSPVDAENYFKQERASTCIADEVSSEQGNKRMIPMSDCSSGESDDIETIDVADNTMSSICALKPDHHLQAAYCRACCT